MNNSFNQTDNIELNEDIDLDDETTSNNEEDEINDDYDDYDENNTNNDQQHKNLGIEDDFELEDDNESEEDDESESDDEYYPTFEPIDESIDKNSIPKWYRKNISVKTNELVKNIYENSCKKDNNDHWTPFILSAIAMFGIYMGRKSRN